MGGGRFFPFAAPVVAGAARVAIGSGSFSFGDWVTSSCRALKLRFLRMGVVIVRDPRNPSKKDGGAQPKDGSDDARGGEGTLEDLLSIRT